MRFPSREGLGVCFTYNRLIINYIIRSSQSPESKAVIFLQDVIPNPPRNAGVRNLIKLIKVWVIWLCPILYPDPVTRGGIGQGDSVR